MNVHANALSSNSTINEEKSKNVHDDDGDDDNIFMTSREKMNFENIYPKTNHENKIKEEIILKSKYFNAVFTQNDTNDFSESSEGPILLKILA